MTNFEPRYGPHEVETYEEDEAEYIEKIRPDREEEVGPTWFHRLFHRRRSPRPGPTDAGKPAGPQEDQGPGPADS